MVQLKRLYDGECGREDVFGSVSESFLGRNSKDRETHVTAWPRGSHVDKGELLSKLVQSGPNGICKLADTKCEVWRICDSLIADDVPLLFRIVSFRDCVETAVNKALMLPFDYVEMAFRSVKLPVKKGHSSEHVGGKLYGTKQSVGASR